jgi:hypothetical protein
VRASVRNDESAGGQTSCSHLRDYASVDGMMIPMAGAVEWLTPEGRLTYWRGRITRAEYELAR